MRLLGLFLISSVLAWAQDPRGTIAGKVVDTSGAVIPGAKVRATNAATNVAATATTNAEGNYELLYLPVGTYTIGAESAGFKGWTKTGIELRMSDRLLVDIRLEVGQMSERIEVSARGEVLENSTAALGQSLDGVQIAELPSRSGSISWLYASAPGVIFQGTLPFDGPWNIDQDSGLAVAGAGQYSMNFNMDGISNNAYGGRTAIVPPADMVSEVRVDTQSYDASVGHTTGGQVNVTLKSGTNDLHGAVSASFSDGPMMTRTFFTDQYIFDPTTGPITPEKIKANTPSVRWNRYSAVAGGPVYIPKLYNGRNRTFWEFGYQKHDRIRPLATLNSVPTAAERGGDLSALLKAGSQYQIYDPFSTVPAANGRFSRQPLPGNIIPAGRIDPLAAKLIQLYPLPNTAGTVDGTNNWSNTRPEAQNLTQPTVRIDHNFSDKFRMYGRYSESDFKGHFDNYIADSDVRGRDRRRPARTGGLDGVWVVNSSTVLDVRYGFTWFNERQFYDNQNYNLASLGFSPSLIKQLQFAAGGITFPQLSVDSFFQLGNDGGFSQIDHAHTLLTELTWIKGNHSVKVGFDGRLNYETYLNYGNVSPLLTFAGQYTRGPLDNSTAAPVGQGLASFLYGIPSSGQVNYNASYADFSGFYGLYLQDNWRLTRKLTFNIGLRWEFESPTTERYNRSTRAFDFNTPNPISQQALAAYALHPVPQIPVSSFQTLGGVTFAGVGSNPRGFRDADLQCLMPRFGLAYQLTPRMVLRGGYGIYFGVLGADFVNANQSGFSKQTNLTASNDSGQTYIASIANPFPGGIAQPTGAAGGMLTNLGGSPNFFLPDGTRPYTQRWSSTVQFQPVAGSVVELGYLGSKSVHLRVTRQFNSTPAQYLSTSPVRDNTVNNFLTQAVPNPFAGIAGFAGTNLYTNATTSLSQLLQPYPEFGGLSTDIPSGSSWYHALTARFEKRLRHGITAQVLYTFSKTMEASNYRNPTDAGLEHVISSLDRPHHVSVTAVIDLPFGRGKRFGSHWPGILNQMAGGWSMDTVYTFQDGAPLAFGNVLFTCSSYDQLQLAHQSLQQWFDTSCFNRVSAQQLVNNIRTFPTRIAAVRSYGINVTNFSIHKTFPIYERLKLQLRGDAEGITNTPNFAAPNLAPANTAFGQVTDTQTKQEERRVFVGLKLIF